MHAQARWASANPCEAIDLPAVPRSDGVRFLELDRGQRARRRRRRQGGLPGARPGAVPDGRDDRAAPRRADRAALARRGLDRQRDPRAAELRARRVRHPEVQALDAQRAAWPTRWRRARALLKARGEPARRRARVRRPAHGRAAGQGGDPAPVPQGARGGQAGQSHRFHDLRHTFGTAMAAAGVPMRTLQEWMGHRDIETTQRYADYAPNAREAELVRLSVRER